MTEVATKTAEGQTAVAAEELAAPTEGTSKIEDTGRYTMIEPGGKVTVLNSQGEPIKEEADKSKEAGEKKGAEKADQSEKGKKADASKEPEEPKKEGEAEDFIDPDDPKGVKKRITELVRQRNDAQERYDRLEGRLKALEGTAKADDKTQGAKVQPTAETEGKPTRPAKPVESAFEDYEGFEKAQAKYETDLDKFYEDLSDWRVRSTLAQERAAQEKAITEELAAQRQLEDDKKIASGIEKYENFETVAINNGLPYTDDMVEAVYASENFAELAYHLGKHPAEVKRIATLSPIAQMREIVRLDLELQAKSKGKGPTTDNHESPGETKPGLKRTTTAGEPITPVGAGGNAETFDPDTADPRTYFKHRDAEEINRKKRGL